MIDLNSPREVIIGLAALIVMVAGVGIVMGGISRGNFGKAMTKGAIVVIGIIIIGLGAAGGNALINMGQGGAEQIGINAGQ